MRSSDWAVGRSPVIMTKFCVALAVNTPGVVINLVRSLTASSIYEFVVSKSHHSIVNHAEKKHQLEPEALQQSERLRDCTQSRARSTKDDSNGGVHGPGGGM